MTGLTIDTREFGDALKEYYKYSERELSEIINTKAFYIARGAARDTHKILGPQIEAELGVVAYDLKQIQRGKNKGKFRKAGVILTQSSLAERLLAAIYHRTGKAFPPHSEFMEEVKRYAASRRKSAAFLASGWIPAIKKLAGVARDKGGAPKMDPNAKLRTGANIGSATPARPGINPTAIIENSAVSKSGEKRNGARALEKHAGEALQRAIANEIRSMAEYIAKKMGYITEPFNGR